VADHGDRKPQNLTRTDGGMVAPAFEVELETPASPHAIAALCRRVRSALLAADNVVLICDLRRVTEPDATVIDALARIQLTARRLGRSIELRHARPQIRELVRLAGLADVLPLSGDLPVDPRR
jgi:ABC-type transporter Mla MlaB component